MATDDLIEENLKDEKNSSAKILGLSKNRFILVATSLLTILLVIAGYFIFASSDSTIDEAIQQQTTESNQIATKKQASAFFPEQGGEQTASQTNEINQQPDQNTRNNQLMMQIFELREQVITLREEKLQLKKQIYDLQTQDIKSADSQTLTPQEKPQEKLPAMQQQQNIYQNNLKEMPPIQPAVDIEKPKPKWG